MSVYTATGPYTYRYPLKQNVMLLCFLGGGGGGWGVGGAIHLANVPARQAQQNNVPMERQIDRFQVISNMMNMTSLIKGEVQTIFIS